MNLMPGRRTRASDFGFWLQVSVPIHSMAPSRRGSPPALPRRLRHDQGAVELTARLVEPLGDLADVHLKRPMAHPFGQLDSEWAPARRCNCPVIDHDRHHCFDRPANGSTDRRVNQAGLSANFAAMDSMMVRYHRAESFKVNLRLVVHMDQSKALGVPLAPFEIVHDGPVEVPVHGPIRDGFQLQQILPVKSMRTIVADATIRPTQSMSQSFSVITTGKSKCLCAHKAPNARPRGSPAIEAGDGMTHGVARVRALYQLQLSHPPW